MRNIVHLSDLHFGRLDSATIQPLIQAVTRIQPDLVAVSGDLTQRARVDQFKDARAFLDSLPSPQIVVPGNHDVPLDNPILRFAGPLSRFKRYITHDLAPTYIDDEIAVLGLNTTRRLLGKGGRVNAGQAAGICEDFGKLSGNQIRIVVTHHPFDFPKGFGKSDLVRGSQAAMETFAKCRVDIFLAGHLHVTHSGNTARYDIEGHSALVIQAGTATSTRSRGESNSFNTIRADGPRITVETYTWDRKQQTFSLSASQAFLQQSTGWTATRAD